MEPTNVPEENWGDVVTLGPTEDINLDVTPNPSTTSTPILEGYLLDLQGAKIRGGTITDLLLEEGELHICVSTRRIVCIRNCELDRLQEVIFSPDNDMFRENFRVVVSSSESLQDELTREDMKAFEEGEQGDIFVWVREELPTPPPTIDSGNQLMVEVQNYIEGVWSCVPPEFKFSGINDDEKDYSYAAIVLDERIIILSDDIYSPKEEGVFSLRFAIMNEQGDLTCRTEKYNLWLDYSLPEMKIEINTEKDYCMTIYVSDELSEPESISLDGGKSWTEVGENCAIEYEFREKRVFAPGMILTRDVAGNITMNADIIIKKI